MFTALTVDQTLMYTLFICCLHKHLNYVGLCIFNIFTVSFFYMYVNKKTFEVLVFSKSFHCVLKVETDHRFECGMRQL